MIHSENTHVLSIKVTLDGRHATSIDCSVQVSKNLLLKIAMQISMRVLLWSEFVVAREILESKPSLGLQALFPR